MDKHDEVEGERETLPPNDSATDAGRPLVSIVISAYRRPRHLAVMLHCLQVQTLEEWEAIVVHETPSDEIRKAVESMRDPRLRYLEVPDRWHDWGNSCKEAGTAVARGDWIGHSNDDNYYAPEYFRLMIAVAEAQRADFVYCDMVHSHHRYQFLETAPVVGRVDGGGWLCRASIVKGTPWPSPKNHPLADGRYVEALVRNCHGVAKVRSVLFVHN